MASAGAAPAKGAWPANPAGWSNCRRLILIRKSGTGWAGTYYEDHSAYGRILTAERNPYYDDGIYSVWAAMYDKDPQSVVIAEDDPTAAFRRIGG